MHNIIYYYNYYIHLKQLISKKISNHLQKQIFP